MPDFFFFAFPLIVQGIGIALLGLSLGSFCTVLIHRIPEKQAWWRQQNRSQCSKCKKTLRFIDLIPLYSWLKAKGSCRYCQAKISPIYPLVELGVAIACLLTYLFLGVSAHAFFIMVAIPFLAASLVIDFRSMILPNQLTLIIGILALGDSLYGAISTMPDAQPSTLLTALIAQTLPKIIAAIIFFFFAWLLALITKLITKRPALGMGDIKFFFVVGLWLGITPLSTFAILSGALGVVSSILWRLIRKKSPENEVFPFGPSLIVSLYVLLLFQTSHLM